MTNVQQVLPVYQQFKDAFDRNELEKAVQLVAQLKVSIYNRMEGIFMILCYSCADQCVWNDILII